MELNGKVLGLKELETSLHKLGKQYSDPKIALQTMRPAMRKSMKSTESAIRSKTPVDSGELANSTKIRIRNSNKKDKQVLGEDSVMVADVGWHWTKGNSLMNKALAVEYGNKVTIAQPTLRPALQQNASQIVNVFRKELIVSIENKARKLHKKVKPK